MSRTYVTISRTSTGTTIVYHQPAVGPSTTGGALRYQIGHQSHQRLSPPTKLTRGRQYLEQQQTYPTHLRYEAEYPHQPPLLSRPSTIPLPALTDVPIIINPLLSYTLSKVAFEYDLSKSPMTAHLQSTTKMNIDHRGWRKQPAMNPSTVGSMTIVIPGVERAVVVFPATLNSAVVTVGDVLSAVHCAMRGWVIGRHDGIGVEYRVEGRRPNPNRGQCEQTGNVYNANEFREGPWWAGLSLCQRDRDVWILRTIRALPAIFSPQTRPLR